MLVKRIIPCLDIKDGKTVKGVNFKYLREAGDPIELVRWYTKQGADELIFLDITATNEKRKTLSSLVKKISRYIDIPFTVGGGIREEQDVESLLNAGADRISINTFGFKNPKILEILSRRFGSQCIVLSIDTKYEENEWRVYLNGGRIPTRKKTLDWAEEGANRGAGEILLTSMNHDGTKNGFAIDIIKKISERLSIPVIASGGAGKLEDFYQVFKNGKADAALAASIFHYGEIKIPNLKCYLNHFNIPVRITTIKDNEIS
ncbi:imidazole glycerol phosphate synthase subunit hisF [Blattabacterium sp. (Mastotermes darwiniensis) str. MADAR]|uniref:imidazole glycerol phosphate synthase subunit HisF n=1 Tax=Blattabacterium sp. (Mastotermes darwiniensis) TaxID=39768 RepID=UPI000231DFC7|nr:imidazole glycerol phosphate synthase subunit HisF [Blattabacterium sp. (Mastotermes darwiniensis)]AER40479.1 imidazole glycerol phosphate synthase subunit hisF [Blattabacterium sp. (Mastotermes darwiniensis) str. MADAR]